MNKPLAGATMCLPHIANEIRLRIKGNSGSQAEKIYRNMLNVCEGLHTIHKFCHTEESSVRIKNWANNHTAYFDFNGAIRFTKGAIRKLWGHFCVIGDTTMDLLTTMFGFLSMVERKPCHRSRELFNDIYSLVHPTERFI